MKAIHIQYIYRILRNQTEVTIVCIKCINLWFVSIHLLWLGRAEVMSLYKHVLAKEQQLVQPVTKWLPVHSSHYTFSTVFLIIYSILYSMEIWSWPMAMSPYIWLFIILKNNIQVLRLLNSYKNNVIFWNENQLHIAIILNVTATCMSVNV